MTHHQQRAGEIEQQLLEQVQCFDIQIVGRLIQHQQIERSGKESGKQQTIPLAARQRLDRRARPIGRK